MLRTCTARLARFSLAAMLGAALMGSAVSAPRAEAIDAAEAHAIGMSA